LLFWAIATALGAVLAGLLGLELLKSVGVASAPVWLEILVTGLRSAAAPNRCTT